MSGKERVTEGLAVLTQKALVTALDLSGRKDTTAFINCQELFLLDLPGSRESGCAKRLK